MALDFQNVSIDFTGGIARKQNEKLVLPGKLKTLENGWFAEDGSISPVYGSTALSNSILGGGSLSAADALATYRDELVRIASNSLYVYTSSGWVLRGSANDATAGTLERTQVVRNSASQTAYDMASTGGVTVYAWAEAADTSAGGLSTYYMKAAAFDEATGVRLMADATLDTQSAGNRVYGVKCVAVSGAIFVFWWSGDGAASGTITGVALLTASPTAFGSPAVIAEVAGTVPTDPTKPAFDAVTDGTGNSAVMALSGSGSNTTLVQVNRSGSTLSVAGSPAKTNIAGASSYLTLIRASSGNFVVVRTTDYFVRSSTFAAVLAATTFDASNTRQPVIGTTNGTAFTVIGYDSTNVVSRKTTLTESAVTVAAANFIRTAIPSGKPFVLSSRLFVPMVFVPYGGGSNTTVQPCGVLVDTSSGVAVARVLSGRASHAEAVTSFAGRPSAIVSGSTASFLASERGRLAVTVESSGTVRDVTRVGVSRMGFELTGMASVSRTEVGKGLFVAGALPMLYDGISLTEHGPHQFPENLTSTAGAGGSLSTGTYQWRGVYEWLDAAGQLHRSAPSPAISVSVTSGQSKKIRVPTLKLTRRTGARAVAVHLFRTEANGTIFYRSSSITAPRLSDSTTDYIEFDDGTADTTLVSNEILYTQAGAPDTIAPPACRFAHVHRNRLFIGGLEDPSEFWFTSSIEDGEAPRFTDEFTARIEGNLAGFGTIDDKLVLFGESKIYAVAGDGPDALGQNDSFTEPQDILAPVGCADWRSVVSTDAGLFFLGSDGCIWLLTRGLQCVPIGEDVKDLVTAASFTRALHVKHLRQVRFYFSNTRLDFDLLFQQWSAVGQGYADDAAVLASTVYRCALESVTRETPSSYEEFTLANQTPDLIVETAWIKTAGLQGFQRAQRVLLLGDYLSACTVSLEAGYDNSSTYDAADRILKADDGTYSAGGVFQLEHPLRVQKCEAIRFRITASPPSGGGISLQNLTLRVGLKRGTFRGLPSTKRA